MKAAAQRQRPVNPPKPVSHPYGRGALLQRKCACGGSAATGGQCDDCQKGKLQRKARDGYEGEAPQIVHEVLGSPGKPLDRQVRAYFEPRFGHDFGSVRVHDDARAARSAAAINARAYAAGHDVAFAAGEYTPGSASGRELIAHELAHTIQQEGAHCATPDALRIAQSHDSAETEADSSAKAALEFRPPAPAASYELGVSREAAAAPGRQSQGYPPAGHCDIYWQNSWWLPFAYVNNATCACMTTPDVPSANCVRKSLQDRLANYPSMLKFAAMGMKPLDNFAMPAVYESYQLFVQSMLTPQIYRDHVDAYRECGCPAGPATYEKWIGVTSIPIRPCSLVGWFIRNYGSCTGLPDSW